MVWVPEAEYKSIFGKTLQDIDKIHANGGKNCYISLTLIHRNIKDDGMYVLSECLRVLNINSENTR